MWMWFHFYSNTSWFVYFTFPFEFFYTPIWKSELLVISIWQTLWQSAVPRITELAAWQNVFLIPHLIQLRWTKFISLWYLVLCMALWRDFSKLQDFKTKTKMKMEICFECYWIHEATIPTLCRFKELLLCSGMALISLLTVAVIEGRELIFLCERNYWRTLIFLKILFAIWKSTSSSVIKHNKIVPELIRLIRLRVVGDSEIYPSN